MQISTSYIFNRLLLLFLVDLILIKELKNTNQSFMQMCSLIEPVSKVSDVAYMGILDDLNI